MAKEASKINLSFKPTAIEMPSPTKKITKHEQRRLEREQRKLVKEEKKKAILDEKMRKRAERSARKSAREMSSSAKKRQRSELENTPKTTNFLDNMGAVSSPGWVDY